MNMEIKVLNYRIIITPEKHEGKIVYNALCPALGVADWGETIDQAIQHIQGAMECYIEALMEDKQPIPSPDEPNFTISTATVNISSRFKPTFI